MTRRFRATLGAVAVVVLTSCGSAEPGIDASSSTPTSSAPGAAIASGFKLGSTAFDDNQPIPKRFTCQGASVSPALTWSGLPAGTRSLALLVVDPDAPVQDGFTHWVLAGIDPSSEMLAEASSAGTPGANSTGATGYAGPCPPSGNHHYVFTLYALAAPISGEPSRAAIEAAGAGALGTAVLTGTYQKS